MAEHPHDASDPSSEDGPAVATRAEVRSGQGYLLRDRPPPRTADDIAALIIDRDDARAAMYRAHDDMWKVREDCAALRAEVGALTTERDTLKARLALLDSPDLLERLADLEHWRWSGWEEYRAEKAGITHPNGERYTERWRRQGCTAYANLSESEKESDRVEARKGLAVIKAMMGEVIGES